MISVEDEIKLRVETVTRIIESKIGSKYTWSDWKEDIFEESQEEADKIVDNAIKKSLNVGDKG